MQEREDTLLLLARAVTPQRRTALPGGSLLDDAYTALNQAAAVVVLVLLSPLLLFLAACIWWQDGTPFHFAHYRVGKHGRLFRCFKFRTMVHKSQERLAEVLRTDEAARAEWERDHKLRNDPRVTRIGLFMRKTSLDELPQLFNILRGEMNFVGPRPVTIQELPRYASNKRHYLSVRPGLTGLWQVSGRNNTTYEQRVLFDATYVERRNPVYDIWIVLRTVKVIITRQGAH